MKLGIKGNIVVAIACAAFTIVSTTRAADDTSLLADFRAAVADRADDPAVTNAAQKKALANATKILNRKARTPSAELSALATAATVLNTRFPDDTGFLAVENNTLASYALVAQAQLNEAQARISTNTIPKGLSNQLAKARIALTNAIANTNGVPLRARALAQAYNKLRIPVMQVLKKYPAPPFEAPETLPAASNILLVEDKDPSERTTLYFHTVNDVGAQYYWYTTDNPEEVGTFLYERLTSKRDALLHLSPTFAETGGSTAAHDIALTFTSSLAGTFSGKNTLGRDITGNFTIIP